MDVQRPRPQPRRRPRTAMREHLRGYTNVSACRLCVCVCSGPSGQTDGRYNSLNIISRGRAEHVSMVVAVVASVLVVSLLRTVQDSKIFSFRAIVYMQILQKHSPICGARTHAHKHDWKTYVLLIFTKYKYCDFMAALRHCPLILRTCTRTHGRRWRAQLAKNIVCPKPRAHAQDTHIFQMTGTPSSCSQR